MTKLARWWLAAAAVTLALSSGRASDTSPAPQALQFDLSQVESIVNHLTHDAIQDEFLSGTAVVLVKDGEVLRISGRPYADYMRERIFAPLGMTRAHVETPAMLRGDLAVGYVYRNGAFVPQDYEYYATTPGERLRDRVRKPQVHRIPAKPLPFGLAPGRRAACRPRQARAGSWASPAMPLTRRCIGSGASGRRRRMRTSPRVAAAPPDVGLLSHPGSSWLKAGRPAFAARRFDDAAASRSSRPQGRGGGGGRVARARARERITQFDRIGTDPAFDPIRDARELTAWLKRHGRQRP